MAQLALTGATLMTATKGDIDNGTLLIRNSTIEAIGTEVLSHKTPKFGTLKAKW